MAQDEQYDPISRTYREPSAYTGERGERETRKAVQGIRKLSPEKYQREVNEQTSRDIAAREAYLANEREAPRKTTGRTTKRHGRRLSKRD